LTRLDKKQGGNVMSYGEQKYDQDNSSHDIIQFAQNMGEDFSLLSDLLKGINDSMPDWIDKHPELIESIKQFINNYKNLPDGQWSIWKELAKHGWFVNWDTNLNIDSEIHFTVEENDVILNDYMIKHLNTDWLEITDRIIEFYPKREEILRTAFDLHLKGIYIASIPLFLAQAYGIYIKELDRHLFGEIEERDKIHEILRNGELTTRNILDIFLKPLRGDTEKGKSKELNINGILSGSNKYLDYGTELNSFKAFSLLAFVVFFIKYVIKDNHDLY
jgi:hypothetical protein